jgi:hypothetical protein
MMASIHFRIFCLSLKTEMYETVIVSVVFYGHESWSAPLGEKNESRVFENGMRWKILDVN